MPQPRTSCHNVGPQHRTLLATTSTAAPGAPGSRSRCSGRERVHQVGGLNHPAIKGQGNLEVGICTLCSVVADSRGGECPLDSKSTRAGQLERRMSLPSSKIRPSHLRGRRARPGHRTPKCGCSAAVDELIKLEELRFHL